MIGFDFSFLKIASRSLMCSSGVQPYDYLQVMEREYVSVKYISDKDGPATYHFTIFGISVVEYMYVVEGTKAVSGNNPLRLN